MGEMTMHVFKRYRDKHPEATLAGYGHMRYFGKVEGEGHAECCVKARKLLGRSNRGTVFLVYIWTKPPEYGYVTEHRKGIPPEKYPMDDAAMEYGAVRHMMATIAAGEDTDPIDKERLVED